MSNLLALLGNEQKNQFALGNDEYYQNDEDAIGLPPPNTYTVARGNHILCVPPPPPQPHNDYNHENNNKKELGTSDNYISKQLELVMNGLAIAKHARPAMLALSRAQKLTMIQQYNRNHQKPNHHNHKLTTIKAPVLGKNISAPITNGIAPKGTIPISEAQKNFLKLNKRSSDADIIHHQKAAPARTRHKKSRSNIYLSTTNASTQISIPPPVPKDALYPPSNIKAAKTDPCLPPPVPQCIKQKYAQKPHSMDTDDEYEYYEEPEPEPAKLDSLKVKKVKKHRVKNVKVKLRVGSEIEVYSNSKKRWIDGNIIRIKGKLICVAYGVGTQKWLEASSKNFRPKMSTVKKLSLLSLNPRPSSTSVAEVEKTGELDAMNNPTEQRCRESVAFTQKKQVKVKLRIGSPVEVYSVSKNRWIDGELRGIKKDLIKVAYGKGFTTEKWLRANSKQFRPKLDMVDAAIHRKNTVVPTKKHDYTKNHSVYSIDSDEESVGTHIPAPMLPPAPIAADKDANSNRPPPPMPGAYVTHSLRREQYQQFSVDAVQGTNKKRGDLKIKIHGALQLRHNGNFASITIADHTLKTKKIGSDENPVWKEILTFSNFRPHIGKTGVVSISNKSAIMGEKMVGSAEFELPIVFSRQEKMSIDIARIPVMIT